MTVVADAYESTLFVHVAGAMLMVGALIVVAYALITAARGDRAAGIRLAYRALLLGALPGYLVMRIGSELVLSETGFDDEAGWIGIGYITADLGLLLIIISTVLAGLAAKRARKEPERPDVRVRIATGLVSFLLVAYVIAIWAMTTKPD